MLLLACLAWATAIGGGAARSLARPSSSADGAPRHCDWTREHRSDEAPTALACRLRTVAGAPALLADLPAARAERVSSLTLECSDALFFESSLEIGDSPSFLGRLKRLRSLRIEYCKIRYVPAAVLAPLADLRALALRTHNTDWSAMSMEFHRDSFRGLRELRELDLGDNNVWNLPAEVFCPLANLRTLNLSSNRLRDISQMGFSDWGEGPTAPGKSCNMALETLDVSRNDIITLPDNGLTSLRSLQRLFLQDNAVSLVTDRAFVGLSALQILNLSSNSLEALPPEMLQSSRDIKQIYLNNNSINVLAPGLFEGLDQLQILDLSQNALNSEWVNRDTFSGLVRLIVLNLSHNKISKIDSLLFQDLNNLQFLSLENNKISRISEGAFSNLKNLHSLSLAHNKLTHVDAHHFSNLYVLSQLFLDGNRIENIHNRAFENITKLRDLGLSNNALEEVPESLKTLRFLKSLDLGNNEIATVDSSNFEGLDELIGLRLVENNIVNISKDAFITLPSLQILNLATNKIKHVDQSAFGSNPSIKAIRLDSNELTDIRGVFTNMISLGWLNISDNKLAFFDYSDLPASLEWLDMHQNRIQKLENHFGPKSEINIKMLDVSFNLLTGIDGSSLPSNIQVLFLNDNHINRVNSGTFLNKPYLEKVVFYGNQLKTLDVGAFALTPVPDDRDLPEFYIGGNPFHCDCTMEWLQGINHLSHARQHPRVMDLDIVTCTLAHSRGKTSDFLLDLKPSQFLCPYETHCFALCHCCDFDACDCKMTCPDKCSCYHDLTWSSNVVDCSNLGLEQVPSNIPMDATEIYLDGNDFKDLNNHVFIGKKKLQTLYLNNSNIHSINNKTFIGIDSLKNLHLENNSLQKLDGSEFKKLTNLNALHLENNHIRSVQNDSFASLASLEILKLDNNEIVDVLPWRILNDERRTRVSLAGNKWRCDCDSITELKRWLSEHSDEGADKLICQDEEDAATNSTLSSYMERCKKDQVEEESTVSSSSVTQRHLFLDSNTTLPNYVPYVAVISAITVIALLLCVLLFLFREEFRLWMHSKYGVRVFTCSAKSINDHKHKNFDAYVVYSLRDEDFVSRAVAAELERGGRTLCLHHRDLQTSADRRSDVDVVLSGVENSKRLLVVLSMAFIQNEWYRPEFRAALQSGVDAIDASHRRQKIVFIVITDLSALALDPDLKALLKTCTVIVWGERNCREKLNFRLPDARVKLPDRTAAGGGGGAVANHLVHHHLHHHHQQPLHHLPKQANVLSATTRYTASPTCHSDTWYRYNRRAAVRTTSSGSQGGTPSPTQSTCVSGAASEDEGCWEGSGGALEHNYASIDSREHVRPLQLQQQQQQHRQLPQPQHRAGLVQPPLPPPPAHARNTYFV